MMGLRLTRLMTVAAVSVVLTPRLLAWIGEPADRVAAWREDLATFAREFPAAQKDFDTLYPRARFHDALAALTRNVPAITDADIVLGLMRLVAGAHIGHTYVRIPTDGPLAFHRLPIGVQWFSDGLVVTAATDPYIDALGFRIIAIGTLSPEQLQSAVAIYISYEHDAWLRLQSQTVMLSEEVLRAVGQVDADGRVGVTLARPDGSTMTLKLAPVVWTDRSRVTYVTTAANAAPGPARVDPSRYYRYEILPDTKTLYVRYNRCENDPRQVFTAFARELFATVDARPNAIDRLIVDLRANGGGNSGIITPLLDGLRARKALSARGHLYALIGPATFSSGLLAALELKKMNAILVGETPGEKLNSYGEVRQLTLPRSRLVIQYSTKYFKLRKGGGTLEPDLRVTRSINDLLTGKDPELDAAVKR